MTILLFVWFYFIFKIGVNYKWFKEYKVKGPLFPVSLSKGQLLSPRKDSHTGNRWHHSSSSGPLLFSI